MLLLDDGFDHDLPVGEVDEVRGEGDAAEGGGLLVFAELAGAHSAGERRVEPALGRLHRPLVALADDDVEPGPGRHLRDARAHDAAADDSDRTVHALHGLSSRSQRGTWFSLSG